MKEKALVVVDVQHDFVAGALGSPEAQAALPRIEKLIEEYRDTHQIIATMDCHNADYLDTWEGKKLPVAHCIIGTDGVSSALTRKDVDQQFIKSDFAPHGFHRLNFKSWDVCGIATDVCVISTVFAIRYHFPDAEITVHAACCAGTSPENHEIALKAMKNIYVKIV